MIKLYLDSCAIIYAIEGKSSFQADVLRHLAAVESDPAGSLVTSKLSRLECRVKPLRDADQVLLARYDTFFSGRRLYVHNLTASVIEIATDLRARYRFKSPDALHLASAIELKADAFLTGDAALRRCVEVQVQVI